MPLRVMRQLARFQEIPCNDDMSRFSYYTPIGFAFNSEDIMNIWYEIIIFELSEMVVEQDRGKVVLGYLSWFRDSMVFGYTPKNLVEKKRDQRIIIHLKKELERPKQPLPATNSGPNRKKSPVRVARYEMRIEACRGEISPNKETIG